MKENDLHFVESEGEPQEGEIRMIHGKRNGVESIELQMWTKTGWTNFDDFLKSEGEDFE